MHTSFRLDNGAVYRICTVGRTVPETYSAIYLYHNRNSGRLQAVHGIFLRGVLLAVKKLPRHDRNSGRRQAVRRIFLRGVLLAAKNIAPSCLTRRCRKRRDSNPRALAGYLISSQARYDHFDTLPCGDIAEGNRYESLRQHLFYIKFRQMSRGK